MQLSQTQNTGFVERWQNAFIALAISNFFYFPIWQVLQGSLYEYYFPDRSALRLHLFDLLIEILLVAAVFYSLLIWSQKGSKVGRVSFAAAATVAISTGLWSFGKQFQPQLFDRIDADFLFLTAGLWTVCIVICLSFPTVRHVAKNALLLSLVTIPVSTWNVWQASRHILDGTALRVQGNAIYQESGSLIDNKADKNPLIWIVFDEFDQRLAFENPLVDLPNFNRFRQGSFYASAVAPSHFFTEAAIPSMLSGHLFKTREVIERGDEAGIDRGYWLNRETLFSEFKAEGMSTAVVGWYHPYCSVLGRITNRCFSSLWVPGTIETYLLNDWWLARALQNAKTVAKSIPLVLALYQRSQTTEKGLQRGAKASVSHDLFEREKTILPSFLKSGYSFLFVHLPIPHPPGIAWQSGGFGGDYIDNLALADKTFGEIRHVLEKTGRWKDATVLVTGDHHLRTSMWGQLLSRRVLTTTRGKDDPRMVFLLKLPSQTKEITYTKPFNALLIHDLARAIKHRIMTPEDLREWIDANRGRFETGFPPRT